jgi:transposase
VSDALADLDLEALPEAARAVLSAQAAELRAMREDIARIAENNAELAALNARLEHLVKEFRQALYGRKSEKLGPEQRDLLFEDLETAIAEVEAKKESRTRPASNARAPARNIGRLPKHLPRIEKVIEPADTNCPCGCGPMAKIGEDRSERLDIIPAQFRVIETVRPRYACRACLGKVAQAPAPAHLIEGALPTEALLAHVIVAKFADHCPLYRQAGIYARSGVDLDRSTLSAWVGRAAFHLAPVVDRLAAHLKRGALLFMDETRAPVLDPGRGRTRSGYFWALARDERGWSGADPPGVVYFYADGRAGRHAEAFLIGWKGVLQVDGYAGYNQLTRPARTEGPVTLAYCWSHARRKLKEAFEASGSPIAEEGLKRVAELYRIEATIRGRTPEARLAARRSESAPLVADFGRWLGEKRARVSAKSRLGEKLAYIANHWDGLNLFLEDGRVEMDSNAVENRIRPIALTRKNALFAGHDEGARAWARLASLIETARVNGVDPFAYIKATLEALAAGCKTSRLDELMPWNFAPHQAADQRVRS